MEICQFCKMYMKPIINREEQAAKCEFCGEVIAKVAGRGNKKHWQKVALPLPTNLRIRR